MTRRLFTHGALIAAALASLCLPGCVSPQEATVDPTESFEWLYQRDLSRFERQIAMQRHHGQDDAWTNVGEAWLDFVNCAGLDQEEARIDILEAPPGQAPLAELMYATVVLEMRRRNARAFTFGENAAGENGVGENGVGKQETTLFSRIDAPGFFDRQPKPLPDNLIAWPGEQEAWVDEGMGTVAIDSACDELRENLLEVRRDSDDASSKDARPSADGEHRRWLLAQLSAAERAVDVEGHLDKAHTGQNLALLMWRVRTHGAHLAAELASSEIVEHDIAPPENEDRPASRDPRALRERGLALLEPLTPELPGLERAEASTMLFLRARLRVDLEDHRAALADLERALALGLERPNAERARYLAVKILTDEGRWEEASSVGAPLPRRTSPLFEPFAYRLTLAARQVDDDERFFRIAMEVLADSPGSASVFQRAIYAQALDLLATYTFDGRVVEIVENLGPRNQVFDRLAELAGVSLKRGYPEAAAASASWLLRHHHNYRYTPKYHRLLAIAAFLRDDEPGFRDHVHAMTQRSPDVIEAVGAERQAQFFADADRAFARLMGQMLPAMADWGDSPGAKKRRQKWLTITVEETQAFLRGVERSQVRKELLDLYRVASKLLEEHPRGYAERLGTKEPTPLVLGTVEVGYAELVDREPRVEPVVRAPYSLTLVPRAKHAPGDWQFGWPDSEETSRTNQGGKR